MEGEKLEGQYLTENHTKGVVKENATPKGKNTRSKFQKWKNHGSIKVKYELTIELLKKQKPLVSGLLTKVIPNDKYYHSVSATMLEDLLRKEKLDPEKTRFARILTDLHFWERSCQ